MLYSPTVAAEFFIWKSTTRAHDRRTEKHFIFKPGFLKAEFNLQMQQNSD